VLRLELDAIRALLTDYFNRDDWWAIEHPGSARIATVIGGKSPAFSREDRARVEAIARKYGELRPVHVIEHSGHWVHVDAPDELAAIVIEELSRTDRLRSSRAP
jgi:pimeloyl-ACP methyl ester carboxylesterase